jgi:WD40 repeat protein
MKIGLRRSLSLTILAALLTACAPVESIQQGVKVTSTYTATMYLPTSIPHPTSSPAPTATPSWPPEFYDSHFDNDPSSLGYDDSIGSIAFSPDGRTFVTAGNLLVIRNAVSNIYLVAKRDHHSNYRSVTYSPDSKLIASGTADSTILIYDADNFALLETLEARSQTVIGLAFSPDGRTLASGQVAGNIILWEVISGNRLRTLYDTHSADVNSLAFSPDGSIMASGSTDKTIVLWDTATWQPIRTLKGHTNSVYSVAFLQDGATLASGARDGTIILWDVASGAKLFALDGNSPDIRSIALSPDGKLLASGSFPGMINIWDLANRSILQTFQIGQGWMGLTFSLDGRTLVGSSFSGIYIWKSH